MPVRLATAPSPTASTSNAKHQLRIEHTIAGVRIRWHRNRRGDIDAQFCRLRWRQSSRLTALIITAAGAPVFVSPPLERGKLKEMMVIKTEVRDLA
jgi:hypothetical protein